MSEQKSVKCTRFSKSKQEYLFLNKRIQVTPAVMGVINQSVLKNVFKISIIYQQQTGETIKLRKYWTHDCTKAALCVCACVCALADLGGRARRTPPLRVQILSF